jgi:hypothetical protein
MNKIFQKAMTVAASTALIGMTVGVAAAANYPSPFTSNTAVVVGANAAASDSVAAGNVLSGLNAAATSNSGGNTVVSGGDSYKFEKTSTKFHLGDTITGVVSSDLDEDELPNILKDGEYTDNDNEEFDFTQKIKIDPSLTLSMFENDDYSEDDPTVGFEVSAGTRVLNYTLDFTDEPLIDDLVTTDLNLMGKDFYVLSNGTSSGNLQLTLLDAADDTILTEGETATLNAGGTSYTVSIEFISSTEVKLSVNGETTNSLSESQTYKLNDGSYLGVKDILYDSKDTGVSKVEFSIGKGKLILTGGGSTSVELNEDSISGLYVTMLNQSGVAAMGTVATEKLSEISLIWETDDNEFITPSSSITMPGFGGVKLSFGGLSYPEEETIEVKQGGDLYAQLNDFPLKDTEADINFLYATTAGNFTGIGKDADEQLLTAASGAEATFTYNTHDYMVATWDDGNDAESYLVRFINIEDDGTNNITDVEYMVKGTWTTAKTDRKDGDTFDIGNVEISIVDVNKTGSTRTVSVINNSANTNFNTLYSKEGLKVNLPYAVTGAPSAAVGAINFGNGSVGHNETSFLLTMTEEDKDDDNAAGDQFNISIGWDSSSTAEVEVSDLVGEDVTAVEIGDTDVYRSFMYSALATEFLWEQPSSGQDSIKVIYHGGEVSADVYITSVDATVSSGGDAGIMSIMDSEVASASGKNLVVVGGSAINTVAADLLGGAYSEGAFTAQTGVSAGEFLIQSFSRSGKTALLVAGYNAPDTTKAVDYLLNNDVDTTIGNKYVGTSATQATMVVA